MNIDDEYSRYYSQPNNLELSMKKKLCKCLRDRRIAWINRKKQLEYSGIPYYVQKNIIEIVKNWLVSENYYSHIYNHWCCLEKKKFIVTITRSLGDINISVLRHNYIIVFECEILILILIIYLINKLIKINSLNLAYNYNNFISYFVTNEEFVNKLDYFPEASVLEKNYKIIKYECLNVLNNTKIPGFHEVTKIGNNNVWREDIEWDKDQLDISFSDKKIWKTFVLKIADNWIYENCNLCPKTYELIKNMDNIKTALFSILPPGKHIKSHFGISKALLRYHLALQVPKNKDDCYIIVNGKKKNWEEGKDFMFDDTYIHEVFNNTNEIRIVLFLDIIRTNLPLPINYINNFVFKFIKNSKEIDIMKNNIKKF